MPKNYNAVLIRNKAGRTPLRDSCRNGKIEVVKCLMKYEAQIDMLDYVSDES